MAGNAKSIEILFTLLVLSFPFGSFFLPVSLGFMTVYPYLIFLVILAILSFWMPGTKSQGIVKYYLWFVLFFLIYAIAFFPFIDGKGDAIIDIRSIGLMLLTTWVFISVRRFLGFEKWRSVLLFSFYTIMILVTIFALIEMNTGWHFEGAFTEKIAARYIKDSLSHVPVFLWDNPNTFIAYYLLIGGGIILLEPEGKRKAYVVSVVLILSIMFSVVAEARLGQVAVFFTGLIYLFHYLKKLQPAKLKFYTVYVLFIASAVTYILIMHPIVKEIPHAREQKVKTMEPVYPVASAGRNCYPDLLKPIELEIAENASDEKKLTSGRNSLTERIALIKNGLEFLKESRFLGVGPGQYRYRHENEQIKYYAFGNNGAHLWFIELMSQYGVIIFGIYLLILFWIFARTLKYYRSNPEFALGILSGLILLVIASVLPSAFLILDVNWIFTIVLVISIGEISAKKSEMS